MFLIKRMGRFCVRKMFRVKNETIFIHANRAFSLNDMNDFREKNVLG